MDRKAIIIGAGIGGLSCAIMLGEIGCKSVVYAALSGLRHRTASFD